MRILHLLSQTQLTGAEVHALQLAKDFLRHGHQVWIASDEIHKETQAKVILTPIHRGGFVGRLRSAWKLSQIIQQNDIQIIHTHSRAAARVAYWINVFQQFVFFRSIARVNTFHGKHPPSLSKRLHSIYGDTEISICENARDFHVRNKIAHKKTQLLIRNPFELTFLPPRPRSVDKIHWAIAGRLTGPKGERLVFLLREIFPLLWKEFPQLTLDLLGGSLEDLSEQDQKIFLAQISEFKSRVQFIGKKSDLSAELKNYDLVLGGGRVAVEGLAAGASVCSMGEAAFEGLITKENFFELMKSNFGDIAVVEDQWSAKEIFEHLKEILDSWQQNPELSFSKKLEGDSHLPSEHLTKPQTDLQNFVHLHFGHDWIFRQIERVYKSLLAKKQYPSWIPILMYHQVLIQDHQTPHRIFVTVETFEKHLKELQRLGKTSLHFSDLAHFRDSIAADPNSSAFVPKQKSRSLPDHPVILTFDDGYLNNLEHALPLLEKYNMKATVFLLAEKSLAQNSWDAASGAPQIALMNAEQRKKFAAHPLIEIGAHGFKHEKLTSMNREMRQKEIQDSKKSLEEELNIKINVYAYTYGIRSSDASELAERAGYAYAVNTDTGGLHQEDDPFSLFRVSIFPEDGPRQIRKKTSPWYRKYYWFKRTK